MSEDQDHRDLTGRMRAIGRNVAEEVVDKQTHDTQLRLGGIEHRLTQVERDLHEMEIHDKTRERETKHLWMWVIGILCSIVVSVIIGVITINVQIARMEERIGSMREQVHALIKGRSGD
jgi:hypothetical protein